MKKNYILVKDRHPRISEVLNDCVSLCVSASKDESLASILQKICAKITSVTSRVTELESVDETLQETLGELQEIIDSQNLLRIAEVTLTDAQIKALPTTGIQVLPALGEDKIALPVFSFVRTNFLQEYSVDPGDEANWRLITSSNIELSGAIAATGILINEGAFDGLSFLPCPNAFAFGNFANLITGGGFQEFSQFVNKAILFKDLGSLVNYTGGNAANTLKVTIYYTIIDL